MTSLQWSQRYTSSVPCRSSLQQQRHYQAYHYNDVIVSSMASQITILTIVYSTANSGTDQRKHQNSASLAFVWGNSPVTPEFPAQKASNAEHVSIWWRHHVETTFQDSTSRYGTFDLTNLSQPINPSLPEQNGPHCSTRHVVFSWLKIIASRFIFHWNMFPLNQLTISQHWFR